MQLRAIFAAYESTCVVLHDEPQRHYLGTHRVRPKDGYRMWFGGVEIKRNYVSAHVMAVYMQPALLERLSPALKKRMQGKACFNFRKVDDALFAELAALIADGAATLGVT